MNLFFKLIFRLEFPSNIISVQMFDPVMTRHFVGTGHDPNCLQRFISRRPKPALMSWEFWFRNKKNDFRLRTLILSGGLIY